MEPSKENGSSMEAMQKELNDTKWYLGEEGTKSKKLEERLKAI